MSILIDRSKRVLVQGITGREGLARTRLMLDYGTSVVAGVTPSKGGQTALGVPVYNTVGEACQAVGGIDISVLFVPAPLVRSAAVEALEAGIRLLVIVPDRVPLYDVLEIAAVASAKGAHFIGPNTLGVLSPEAGVLGMMGGSAEAIRSWAAAGPVGVTSRSGGITTSMGYYIARSGIGLSTLVHVGGDSVVGTTHADVLRQFQTDAQTELVVMFGEIGTSQEEDAAALIESGAFTKPLIAYVGGRAAKEGTRFSHAGAIIEGNVGTYEGKISRLREVGAIIAESFGDIPRLAAEALKPRSARPTAAAVKAEEEEGGAWKTAITEIQPNAIRLRGHTLDSLMGSVTFGQAIYLALVGDLPTPQMGRLIDAILVASIDHGATPPSTLAARTAASTGAPFNAAVAAGLLSINQHHGGAIEDCMRMIQSALKDRQERSLSAHEAAAALVQSYKENKKRLPGFGHRIHTDDPRTRRLLAIAHEEGVAGEAVAMVEALARAVAQRGKSLPVNVDGAIAALLLELNIAPELGNTFFMMARLPGLIAHVYEEKTRERPMRVIHPILHLYDGKR